MRRSRRGLRLLRVSADEARKYLAHWTQQKGAEATPDQLTDEGFEYWAQEGVCGIFHLAPWPDVWMAHYAVLPEAWGKTTTPAKSILNAFWQHHQPQAIVGWTKQSNRAALSFARRVGFVEHGRLEMPSGTVIQQNWRPV